MTLESWNFVRKQVENNSVEYAVECAEEFTDMPKQACEEMVNSVAAGIAWDRFDDMGYFFTE